MASLFIADALGSPLSVGEQIGLLVFMIVASKGAAGVTGAGLATLAGGLQSHRPDLLDGVGLIVGIDRFMSEARAVTNFSGNAVATMLVGSWTKTIDKDKVNTVLRGDDPFDELTMVDDDHATRAEEPAQERCPCPGVGRAQKKARPVPPPAGPSPSSRSDPRQRRLQSSVTEIDWLTTSSTRARSSSLSPGPT